MRRSAWIMLVMAGVVLAGLPSTFAGRPMSAPTPGGLQMPKVSNPDQSNLPLYDIHYRWESDAWVELVKYVYSFDENGRLVSEMEQSWSALDGWSNSLRTGYTYGAAGDTTEILEEQWDGTKWINHRRTTFNHPGLGQDVEVLQQVWEVNDWENSALWQYDYDASDRLLELTISTWDHGAWLYETQLAYVYDGDVVDYYIQYAWSGAAWLNVEKFSFAYNASGRKTEVVLEMWTGTEWRKQQRTTYEYEKDSLLAVMMTYNWSGLSWLQSQKLLWAYESDGRLREYSGYHWDLIKWVATFRERYSYDGLNRRSESVYENWDAAGQKWVNYSRVVTVYDDQTSVSPHGGTALADAFVLSQNYPNPFNPSTEISFTLARAGQVRVAVFNTLGQRVSTLFEGRLSAGVHALTWNATGFSSGTYFYCVTTDQGTVSRKMLLLK